MGSVIRRLRRQVAKVAGIQWRDIRRHDMDRLIAAREKWGGTPVLLSGAPTPSPWGKGRWRK